MGFIKRLLALLGGGVEDKVSSGNPLRDLNKQGLVRQGNIETNEGSGSVYFFYAASAKTLQNTVTDYLIFDSGLGEPGEPTTTEEYLVISRVDHIDLHYVLTIDYETRELRKVMKVSSKKLDVVELDQLDGSISGYTEHPDNFNFYIEFSRGLEGEDVRYEVTIPCTSIEASGDAVQSNNRMNETDARFLYEEGLGLYLNAMRNIKIEDKLGYCPEIKSGIAEQQR